MQKNEFIKRTGLSKSSLVLIAILLAFVLVLVFIWLWYDLNLAKLNKAEHANSAVILLKPITLSPL